jgi:FCD domain
MCTACKTLQFAWDHLQDGFAGEKVFEHKTSFESPSTNISHLPFGCNSFVELPPFDLTWCPNFMLTVFAIKQLIIATGNTAQLLDDCTRFDHFAQDTGNGHSIVGMGFGKAKHLDTLVLRLVAIAHGNLICSKDRLEVLNHGGFESRYMGGIFIAELSAQDIMEIYQVRERLEGLAARIAAEQMSAEDVHALEHEVALTAALSDEDRIGEIFQSDIRFHKLIIAATHNQRLSIILATLDDQMYRVRAILPRSADWLGATLRDHKAIVEQIKARDGKGAEQAMEQHLQSACERAMRLVLPLRLG